MGVLSVLWVVDERQLMAFTFTPENSATVVFGLFLISVGTQFCAQ
jgi:hypothetical protein